MTLTDEELAVLGHRKISPQEWADRVSADSKFGEVAVRAAIERARPSYEAAIAAQGRSYQSGAERRAQFISQRRTR